MPEKIKITVQELRSVPTSMPDPSAQNWSEPHCAKCYHRWVYHNVENGEGACSGSSDGRVCINYFPPLNEETVAATNAALDQLMLLTGDDFDD